jgi:hypothetical protein
MQITPRQLINPGVIEYDEKRRDALECFKDAVKKAEFLKDPEKNNWTILGYLLTNEQLAEAQKLILNEDMRRLHTREQLEVLKAQSKVK